MVFAWWAVQTIVSLPCQPLIAMVSWNDTTDIVPIVDLLDPGLSKRPARFDRKYLFPLPSLPQRVQYSEFWRHKLAKNDADIEFPEELSKVIAGITEGFSFAYLKEAFVATLLKLVTNRRIVSGGGEGLNDLPFWKEFKRQVKILREELVGGEEIQARKIGADIASRVSESRL